MKRVLIIDDNEDICFILSKYLEKNGFKTDTAFLGETAVEKLKHDGFHVVLCDYRLPDTDGLELLRKIKAIDQDTVVIVMTGYSDVKIAVKTIKAGAYDYVTKPLHQEEILHTITKALDRKEGKDTKAEKPAEQKKEKKTKDIGVETGDYIVGESKSAKDIFKQIKLVAPTDMTVMIYGESGTGKEAIANLIHINSKRSANPFVTLDCGALPKELAKSELFGHVKGSFTGAISDKVGHFELANGGTFFLDEIANLTYEVQMALLRVLQERKLKRVGGTKEIKLDLRIIVASNEDLYEAVQRGDFREDLYHRFNEFRINIEPLRNRKVDIPLFASYFLGIVNSELGKEVTGFSSEVMEKFSNYPWHGNLRELRNVIKRSVLLSPGDEIELSSLPDDIVNYREQDYKRNARSSDEKDDRVLVNSGTDLKSAAKEAEYDTILRVLREVNYNKTKAAKILNIDRKTLYNKIKAYDING